MKRLALSILALGLASTLSAQPREAFLAMWWNVEALFNTIADSTTDLDFTPTGKYQWTPERLELKLRRTAQVIRDAAQARGFALPDIVGLCNVEQQALIDTLFQKYLKTNDFQTVFFTSSDPESRHIGVAFNRRKFLLNFASSYSIKLDTGRAFTRDIVLVKLDYRGRLLSVVLNHWEMPALFNPATEVARVQAARLLRNIVKSLHEGDPNADILILGDFGTVPSSKLLTQTLLTSGDSAAVRAAASDVLLNLSERTPNAGTVRIGTKWYAYDQAIVSAAMLDAKNFFVSLNALERFAAPYLFQPSRRSDPVGKLFSTFWNGRYIGGYSSHLPISVIVYFNR